MSNVVERSRSAETEYKAMISATSELVWLRYLLHDMGFQIDKPIKNVL